jgi:hypothetical protein
MDAGTGDAENSPRFWNAQIKTLLLMGLQEPATDETAHLPSSSY